MLNIFRDKKFLSIIIFCLSIRLLIIFLFLGHADLDNIAGFVENLNNQQDPLGMPYSIFAHIFLYLPDLFKIINIDYFKALRIMSILSEILLIYSIYRLNIFNIKYLTYFVALNPFLILYSGLHGQIDLWAIGFAILAISEFSKKEITRCSFLFALACLIKPMVLVTIFFFLTKDLKNNLKFLSIFTLTCAVPYILTFNFYIIFKNLFIIFSYMILSTKSSTHIMWFFTEFTNPYSLILIILSIILLKKYFNKIIHQFILILPIIILLKGGLASQYFAWLIPILIFNSKIGIMSSFIFSISYIFSYFYFYFIDGELSNVHSFALNNKFFFDNVVFLPFDAITFNNIYLVLSNISMFLVLINVVYFIVRKRNV
tara:strand:+ start:1363 stop:2478 length:1116 start_codon:yes stop_codon:yes gene_type:complete